MNQDTSNKTNTTTNISNNVVNSKAQQVQPTAVNQTVKAQPNQNQSVQPQSTQVVQPQNNTASTNGQQAQTQGVQQTTTAAPTQGTNNQPKLSPKEKKKKIKQIRKEEKIKAKQLRREKSNFKYIMAVILFISLVLFINFLPEISRYIAEMRYKDNNSKITTGNLECIKKDHDDDFDYNHSYLFVFTKNKLDMLTYKTETRGSLSSDKEVLEKVKNECELLKDQTKKLDGVTIKCSLDTNTAIAWQTLRYKDINIDDVTNGYIEAGGTYPDYKYKDNIDKIEKQMKASGYECERTE